MLQESQEDYKIRIGLERQRVATEQAEAEKKQIDDARALVS